MCYFTNNKAPELSEMRGWSVTFACLTNANLPGKKSSRRNANKYKENEMTGKSVIDK